MSGADTPDLASAWLRALARWWSHYNREFLRGALTPPVFQLTESNRTLGSWDGALRRLSISRLHIERDSWSRVMDTLRHEMAHQYVDEVIDPTGETAHGAAFTRACERLRCDPAALRSPGEDLHVDPGEERVIRRVRKLLSLAGSPNEHEAQAAMRKARRLLLEYNVDLVRIEGPRHFERRTLGEVKGRHPAWELWVAMLLADFFFVEVLWAHSYNAQTDRSGTILEIYGAPTNLEMAEYVHAYLSWLLPRLWDRYRDEQALMDNRERMRFYAGVIQGFHEKLAASAAEQASEPTSRELVFQPDRQLQDYYRWHNPRIVTRMTGGVAATDAFHHGMAEGRRVTIHQPVEAAASNRALRGRSS